jgi:dTMP kinase
MRAKFISFEGIDGAGKSTHIQRLADHLQTLGHQVLRTREPGGTALAESLRELVLRAPMDALTEALLVFAARRDHIQQVIAPALAQGQTVLCDRYTDATFAYQGAGRGFDTQVLHTLEHWVQAGLQPDLTFWFDLDPVLAAQRRALARAPDRFEQQDAAFFHRVRAGYAARMQAQPQRFARIDAAPAPEAVWDQLVAHLEQRGC